MTPPRSEGFVRMLDAELEAMLGRVVGKGTKRALGNAGLDGEKATLGIRDLPSLLDCIRRFFGAELAAEECAIQTIKTLPVITPLGWSRCERDRKLVSLETTCGD